MIGIPRVRGADLAGQVEAVGRHVAGFKPGDDRQYPLSGVAAALRYLGTRQARGKIVISIH